MPIIYKKNVPKKIDIILQIDILEPIIWRPLVFA